MAQFEEPALYLGGEMEEFIQSVLQQVGDNFLLVLVGIVVTIAFFWKKKIKIGYGDKVLEVGGEEMSIPDLVRTSVGLERMRGAKKREIVLDQKELVKDFEHRFMAAMKDGGAPDDTLVELIWLQWQNVLDLIAERNGILEKYHSGTLDPEYKEKRLSRLMDIYISKTKKHEGACLLPCEEIREKVEKAFEDLLFEMKEIARRKHEELESHFDTFGALFRVIKVEGLEAAIKGGADELE